MINATYCLPNRAFIDHANLQSREQAIFLRILSKVPTFCKRTLLQALLHSYLQLCIVHTLKAKCALQKKLKHGLMACQMLAYDLFTWTEAFVLNRLP